MNKYTFAAVCACACSSVVLNIYQYYINKEKHPEHIDPSTNPQQTQQQQQTHHQQGETNEIFEEQMNRTMLYYGEEQFKKIRNSFVVVVGVGGVGSAAAHVLLRTGVHKLRIIDPDVVTVSSLNRNSLAQRRDVGRTKVQVLKEYFSKICPEVLLEIYETFFTEKMAPVLLAGNPDFVLDCIDNRDTKLQLMVYCKKNNIKLISAFGAGSAHDPTKINVCDLKDSFGCVFGKTIRRCLRQRGIHEGILVVVSTEVAKKKIIKLTDDEIKIVKAQETSTGVRISKIGVAMPIPNIFGTVMANCVLSSIANLPVIYKDERRVSGQSVSHQRLQKMYVKWEADIYHTSPIQSKNVLTIPNAKYLMDLFDDVSVISGEKCGTGRFVRWRKDLGIALSNIIFVTKKEFDDHVKVEDLDSTYDRKLVEKIDQLMLRIKNEHT